MYPVSGRVSIRLPPCANTASPKQSTMDATRSGRQLFSGLSLMSRRTARRIESKDLLRHRRTVEMPRRRTRPGTDLGEMTRTEITTPEILADESVVEMSLRPRSGRTIDNGHVKTTEN